MYDKLTIDAVERLLIDGQLSYRAIAERLGISRGTVANVAWGVVRRRDETPPPADGAPLETGPIERCQTCGGRVYMPCQLCKVRAWAAERRPLLPRPTQRGADMRSWPSQPGVRERMRNPRR